MGRYASGQEVINRHKTAADKGVSATVDSLYLSFAENRLDTMLASAFTVPFSSNNITAKDLSIDIAFHKMIQYTDTKKADSIWKNIQSRIDALLSGKEAMVTSSGDSLVKDATVYSTTSKYHPTFGMGDVIDMHPDCDQIEDEQDARE